MKYSIKKYTRRRCYNKNKKKQYSNKGRSIKKRYSRRRITLYKKTKMRNQRKTKKMYQYGGAWKDADGNWHPGDPPTAAAAEESTGAAAAEAMEEPVAAAAEEQGVPGDQVPSANGETPRDYYIDVPLSPTGVPDDIVPVVEDDVAVSKQELLRIFRDFPNVLSSVSKADPNVATHVMSAIQRGDDPADVAATVVVHDIQIKACSECSPGGACVFDRPNQNQLYGKLLEMIFAILKVLLRGDALSIFFSLGPCEPFDIPHYLTRDTNIPQLFQNCAISIKTLLDKKEKLVIRKTPSTGRIACGDAAIFLDSLRQSRHEEFDLKMVVIDYYLEKNEETGRTSSVVPRIMAVYNLTTKTNMRLIFGTLNLDDVISHVSALKERIALAQDPGHTPEQRRKVLSDIRKDVKEFNVRMANGGGGLCCAYKQSKEADTVTDGPKKQIRLQISVVLRSVTMQPKDFNEWQDLGYGGARTIAGIEPYHIELDPFPAQPVQTPKATGKKGNRMKEQAMYFASSAPGAAASAPVKPPGASVKPTTGKNPDSSVARPKPKGVRSKPY